MTQQSHPVRTYREFPDFSQLRPDSKPIIRRSIGRTEKRLSSRPYKLLISALAVSLALLFPKPCQANTAGLPWHPALILFQNMLVGTVAPAAIVFAFAGSLVLYALGGHDEQAGRLFGSGIGGLIALSIVHFLIYVDL